MSYSGTIVIAPALNEGAHIGGIVEQILSLYPGITVAIIDDGSSDDTAEQASSAGAVVLSHAHSLGYGSAIQTGYKYAVRNGFQRLVQVDGDGQHEVRDIAVLLNALESNGDDIVFGSRFLEECGYHMSWPRRIGSRFFHLLTRLLTGRVVSDPTTGFQAMNRRVLDVFVKDIFPQDYPDADVIILLHKLGFSMREVAVRMYASHTGKSMHANPIGVLYYLYKMVISMLLTKYRKLPG